MNMNFEEYLNQGTQKLQEVLSDPNMGDEEREIVTSAFSRELEKGIGKPEGLIDYEPLIYGTSLQFIDQSITQYLLKPDLSQKDYDTAITLCERQQKLIQLFRNHGWMIPSINNKSIDYCENRLKEIRDSTIIRNQLIETSEQINILFNQVETTLDVGSCDNLIQLIHEYAQKINCCKEKGIILPDLDYQDTEAVLLQAESLKEKAEKKTDLYTRINENYQQLETLMVNLHNNPAKWGEAKLLCDEQLSLVTECKNNGFPVPDIKYHDTEEIKKMIKVYRRLTQCDNHISKLKSSEREEEALQALINDCEYLKNDISYCKKKRWELPDIENQNPDALMKSAKKDLTKLERKRKIKRFFTKVGIGIAVILIGIVITYGLYIQGKVQMPCSSVEVVEVDVDTVYQDFKDAGFKNVSKQKDKSGWRESNTVTRITVNNSDDFSKGDYADPNDSVVIFYSSENRVNVTEVLKDWKSKSYQDLEQSLKNEGFKNITKEDVGTNDIDKEGSLASLSLNGEVYQEGNCFIPIDAPIVIMYNVYKINIGTNSADFIGQDYNDVIESLQDHGFTNIEAKEVTDGWAKGNSVISVKIDDVAIYSSEDTFPPGAKIVVEYSSDDRIDATDLLENWQENNFFAVLKKLKDAGFENVKLIEDPSNDITLEKIVSRITLNGVDYVKGDCYIQKDIPIELHYYVTKLSTGQNASDFRGKKYKDVVASLQEIGFQNIKLYRADNLRTGWLTKEGTVKSISINGDTNFAGTEVFDSDAQIVIVVNTFKDKGCEDIKEKAE